MKLSKRAVLWIAYWIARSLLAPVSWLIGYKKGRVGQCEIWAPKEKLEVILLGCSRLKELDEAVHAKLFTEGNFIFWYHPEIGTRCGNIFTVTEHFLAWGLDGVITLLLLSLKSAGRHPHRTRVVASGDTDISSERQMLEWLRRHNISPELVCQFDPAANKQ